jgi:hypothetical protein
VGTKDSNMYEPKVTKRDIEIDRSMVLDKCSEKDCGIPVMVEKDLRDKGRQTRCMACLMRFKMVQSIKR